MTGIVTNDGDKSLNIRVKDQNSFPLAVSRYMTSIPALAEEGGKLVFQRKAEDAIVKLYDIQDQLDLALQAVKDEIERRGLEMNPNFKSVQGDHVKAGYRKYGAKYVLDGDIKDLPDELVVKTEVPAQPATVSYALADSKDIDKYVEEHGSLPKGLAEAPRKAKITLTLLEKNDAS